MIKSLLTFLSRAGILVMTLGVPVSAVTVTPSEMSEARQWLAAHFEAAGEGQTPAYPFSFRYAGQASAELLKSWKCERTSKKLDEQRTEYTLVWSDPGSGLSVRCVAVEYLNLFLLLAEVFKEFYSNTEHLIHMRYMFVGIGGHTAIVPYMWLSVVCSISAFVLFLIPRTRRNPVTLNLGCALIWIGVYLEKGMGLVIPGLTPDTLGEIYEYAPSATEITVAAGIFAVGFLLFTLMVKVATPIMLGEFHTESASRASARSRAPEHGSVA